MCFATKSRHSMAMKKQPSPSSHLLPGSSTRLPTQPNQQNSLFESPIHKKEVMDEMQRLTPHKSPGPDGVTNRMLRSGGEKYDTILHKVIATLWEHQAQPSEWQKLLMQPIYKDGKKPKPDPASYRWIHLSSALAKLFEGIIIKRLTQYTE